MRITIAGRVCVGNGQMMYQITRYYRGRLINEDSIDLPVNRRTAVGRSVGKIGNRIVNYINRSGITIAACNPPYLLGISG